MARIFLIARNVFRGILHRRILYLWIAAIGLLILRSLPAIFFNFGTEALQTVMRKRAVSGALDTWSTLCIALAIFMGASAIGSEISAKTIVSVFARPIRRWEFLLGKWIGIQAFALLSLGLGLIVGFAVGSYLGSAFEYNILGISLAQTAVAISLYSGIAIALSTLIGTASSIAASIVHRPSPLSATRPEKRSRWLSRASSSAQRSNSQDEITDPRRHTSAMSGRFKVKRSSSATTSDARPFSTSKPSA